MKSLSDIKAKLPLALIILLWGIGCFVFFQVYYHYHFFYQEQNQLFLIDKEYILSYLGKPAWCACLIGDGLTQLYYYLYAGPAILTVSLLLVGDLTRRSIERCFGKAYYIPYVVAIAVMTAEAVMSFSESYRLSSIMALAGGLAIFLLFELISRYTRQWTVILLLIFAVFSYWAFGYGAWAMLLLALISEGKQLGGRLIGACTVTLIMVLLTPLNADKMYLKKDAAMTYPGIGKLDAPNFDLEHIFAFENEYYFGNYSKIVTMAEEHKDDMLPEMNFYYCLVLAQQGKLPSEIVKMKQPNLGTFYKIGPETSLIVIKMIDELYYALGDMTYTERAALLANTFSPHGRNVRKIKRLAEANLINGDYVAAAKYLRLLSKTMVHRQWAIDHTPGMQSDKVKAEIEQKRMFINTNDDIRLGDDCYVILTQLLDSNPNNKVALQYLLCSDMLAHDRRVYMNDYDKYGNAGFAIFTEIRRSCDNVAVDSTTTTPYIYK